MPTPTTIPDVKVINVAIGNLKPGESRTITLKGKANALGENVTNTATVTFDQVSEQTVVEDLTSTSTINIVSEHKIDGEGSENLNYN